MMPALIGNPQKFSYEVSHLRDQAFRLALTGRLSTLRSSTIFHTAAGVQEAGRPKMARLRGDTF